jgi:N-acetyltransferase
VNLEDDIILQDDRVLLRPLVVDDLPLLRPFAIEEPQLWRYSLQSAGSEESMIAYIQSAVLGRELGHSYPFIVFDKATNQWAGSTRFYDIQPHNQSLQLGFTWYGKAFQGTGLNAHCKFLLLDYAFSTLELKRVEFRADAENARSIAAMKRIGCTVEGILRSNSTRPDGGRRDSIVLSILAHEWTNGIRNRLRDSLQ